MIKNAVLILVALTLLALVPGMAPGVKAQPQSEPRFYTFEVEESAEPLKIDFPEYRVRVDGWNGSRVEVEGCGTVRSPLGVSMANNTISMSGRDFRPPLWEPALRIKVPRNLPVSISALEIWAKDCVVANAAAKRIYVRECRVARDYRVLGNLDGGWWWRSDGWKRVSME